MPADGIAIVFANCADQRLYRLEPAGLARSRALIAPLTRRTGRAAPAAVAAATPTSRSPRPAPRSGACGSGIADGKVTRAIVAVPLDGSAAADAAAIRVLVTGSDFFAFPTPSPDGQRLAWICWNHPHMPWDGTELRVAPVDGRHARQGRLIKGSTAESVLAPLWRDNDEPVRGHRLDRLVEHLPGRAWAASRRRRCTRPTRSSPARCGSSARGRSRCWATAGWRSGTAAAACGSACSTRRPAS